MCAQVCSGIQNLKGLRHREPIQLPHQNSLTEFAVTPLFAHLRVVIDCARFHLDHPYQKPNPPLGTELCWKIFGVTLDSTVLEFVRHERLT